jgi:hypothetical protein
MNTPGGLPLLSNDTGFRSWVLGPIARRFLRFHNEPLYAPM